VATPIDPTSTAFLLAENRSMPMHVGGLQLFEKPEGAGRDYTRQMFEAMRDVEEIRPLYLKHPYRSIRTGGQLFWKEDDQFDIEHHLRHSALPKPGRVRELLELCGRLHSTRLAWERPLWETHVIEGLRDGRVAMYSKLHHALVDGVSAMRLLQSVLSTDPDQRDMPAPWGAQPGSTRAKKEKPETDLSDVPMAALRTALGITAEAAGHAQRPGQDPDQERPQRDERALAPCPADHVQPDDHRLPPLRRPGLAGRALPRHRQGHQHDAERRRARDVQRRGPPLPPRARRPAEAPLVAMVPVGLNAKQSHVASAEGGNAVGAVMCQLATDRSDPGTG
jgi:diacylglycerol O-acyltransferase